VEAKASAGRDPAAGPGSRATLLVCGGLVALAAFAAIVFTAYQTFLARELTPARGIAILAPLFAPYAGGLFVLFYAREHRNVRKAVERTLVVVLITAIAIFAFKLLAGGLGGIGGGSSSSSDDSDKSSGESGGSSSADSGAGGFRAGWDWFGWGGGSTAERSGDSPSRGGHSGGSFPAGPCPGCGRYFAGSGFAGFCAACLTRPPM